MKLFYKMVDYVKGNFSGYITYVRGDYKLAQKWYNAKGIYYDCIGYLSNVYKEVNFNNYKKHKDKIHILVGNSAAPSNNHIEILDKLKTLKEEDILIYCPLSYGNVEWTKNISEYGRFVFGDKFIPLVNIMPYEQYLDFLSEIDIAIFAHDRQQASANTITLLGMGKTVFLKKTTLYDLFKEMKITVYPFEEFNNLTMLNAEEVCNNINIVKERFSEERLKQDWKFIFENDMKRKI